MKNTGHITINRAIRNHWIWKDPVKYQWWSDLIMEARYKSINDPEVIRWKVIPATRGQIVCSQRFLSNRWDVPRPSIQRFLNRLVKEKMISIEIVEKFMRITILNYDKYQQKTNHTTDFKSEGSSDTRSTLLPDSEQKAIHTTDFKSKGSSDTRSTRSEQTDPNINNEDRCLTEKRSSSEIEEIKEVKSSDLKLTAKEKYDKLPDEFKTFSIKKALKGEYLTLEEEKKVNRQCQEYLDPEPLEVTEEEFWNAIADQLQNQGCHSVTNEN